MIGPIARIGIGGVLAAIVTGLVSCGWAEWPAAPGQERVGGAPGGTAAATPPADFQPRRPPLRPDAIRERPEVKPLPEPPPGAAAAVPAPTATEPIVVRAEPGDTVYALSRRYRVPTRTIIDANNLQPPFRLIVGQRIVLPQRRDHLVAAGDTLISIARLYGVDLATLASANGLVAPYPIRIGQAIRIPDVANLPPRPAVDTAAASSRLPPTPAREEPKALPADLPKTTGGGFLWPVSGPVISGYGPKAQGLHNDGVNIRAARGTPIRAAENGVVVYAGNELRGFGNLVLIRHAGDWVTAYAHADTLLVKRGDEVRKGQEIARVGSSGNVDSPQLHFQLRRGKVPVDPNRYMTKPG